MADNWVTLHDGVVIYVKMLGYENEDRPLIIASHGGPGLESHRESENSYGFLSSYFRVLVYDLRGSGSSTWKGPYTHDQYVADLEELRTWAGDDQCIIAGSSYGGFISLEYILQYPHRVSCLLLRNTLGFGMQLVLSGFRAMITSDRIQADHDMLVRIWAGNVETKAELIKALKDLSVIFKPEFTASGERRSTSASGEISPDAVNLDVWKCSASYNLPRYDLRCHLPSISVPTILVGGKQDVVTTPEAMRDLALGIPGAELCIFDGAGHNLPDDEPGLWRSTVWRFLKTHGFAIGV